MIEAAINELLTGDSAITALVGDRVYYMRSPQNAVYPNLTYQRRSTQRNRHLGGPSGLARATFQVDCWASTQKAARQLAELVRLRMDNKTGNYGDHLVQRIYLDDDLDNWEWQLAGKDAIIGRVTLIFGIQFSEAQPAS